MKRLLSFLLAAALVLTCIQAGILQVSAEISGDYNYSVIDNSTVTINYYLGSGGRVKIPDKIAGYPVTVIGTQAFSLQTSITAISIPNSVQVLGQEAFKNCTGLTRVTIPAGVTEIQMWAFKDCSNLAKVYFLGDSPATMGIQVFSGCKPPAIFRVYYTQGNVTFANPWNGFTTVDFTPLSTPPVINVDITAPTNGNVIVTIAYPNADETLQEYKINNGAWAVYTVPITLAANATVYARCANPVGNTGSEISRYIGNIAVNGILYSILGNKKSVSISGYIGSGGTLTIPSTLGGLPVSEIGAYAFKNKTELTGVVIPDTVGSIGEWAFNGCTGLTSLVIGNKTAVIGNSAFRNCSGLTSLTIPDSVWSLGESVFLGCSALTKVSMSTAIESIRVDTFRDCANLSRVILPDSLKIINNCAFYGCAKLTSVVIPDKLTRIGQEAFRGCSLLANVYFWGNAPSMDTLVFESCASGFKVNYVSGKSGFTAPWYSYTTAIYTPLAAPTIAVSTSNPVSGTVEVTVTYPAGKADTYQNKEYKLSGEGWKAYTAPLALMTRKSVSADYTDLSGKPSYRAARNIDNVFNDFVVVNNGGTLTITQYIGTGGNVIVPALLDGIQIAAIADNAFNSCTTVSGVSIAEGVISIGDSAFYGCTGMNSVTLPTTLTTIGSNAFYGSGIYSVQIPASVLSIGKSAFLACSSLNEIIVDGDNPSYASIDGVLFNKVKTLLIQSPAGLSEYYTIPAGVTTIAKKAFAHCTELYEVTVPAGVKTVSEDAFENCPSLTIYCTIGSAAQDYAVDNGIPYIIIGVSIVEKYASGTAFDRYRGFVYGLRPALTKTYFEQEKVEISGDGYLNYLPSTGNILGTGATVEVREQITDTLWDTYRIVIFGDVNGDSSIDSIDAGILMDVENFALNWDSEDNAAYRFAGDLNDDGEVDSIDAGIIVNYENYLQEISQDPFSVID